MYIKSRLWIVVKNPTQVLQRWLSHSISLHMANRKETYKYIYINEQLKIVT